MLLSNEDKSLAEVTHAPSGDTTAAATSDGRLWLYTFAVVATLVAGFGIRYALMLQNAVINEDGIYYVDRAKKLMAGDLWNGISAYWSPLYSLLTGLIGGPLQDFELGGRIVSLLAGASLIPLTYYLARRLYDNSTALVASVLVATHASLILASTWTMTESLYTFLFIAMIASGWVSLNQKTIRGWGLTGLLIGLLYLTKPEALGFLLLIIFFAVVAILFDRTDFRNRVLGVVLMCLVTSACVIPYVVFMRAKVGEWTLSKKVSTNLPSTLEEDQRLKLIDGGTQTMMDRVWGDEYPTAAEGQRIDQPADTQRVTATDRSPRWWTRVKWAYYLFKLQTESFLPSLISAAFYPLIIIGLFGYVWSRAEAARILYLAAFVLAPIVGYSFAVTNIRYMFAVIPLVLIVSARGLIVLGEWAAESVKRMSAGKVSVPSTAFHMVGVVAILVLSTLNIMWLFAEPDLRGTALEEQRAGQWLRTQTTGDTMRVMSSQATVAYYAGAEHSFLPNEDLATIVDYAKRKNTDFIVFSSRRLPRNKNGYPEVPQNLQQDLELVYSEVAGEGYELRIYKVHS